MGKRRARQRDRNKVGGVEYFSLLALKRQSLFFSPDHDPHSVVTIRTDTFMYKNVH